MSTGRLVTDELVPSDVPAQDSHPMDSSRLLLGLMMFPQKAVAAAGHSRAGDALDRVISAGVLRCLLSTLQLRDPSTVQHSRRVAMLAIGMGHSLGWDASQQKKLEVAALLHDLGKIGVPDHVLFKPGKLSPDETELMNLHHNVGIDVLQACRVDKDVLEIIGQAHYHSHSEEGYQPSNSGAPQGARILAVADAYDSLRTDQAYRSGKSHPEIMKILMDSSGTQFDGNVVSALDRWIENEGLPFSSNPAETETCSSSSEAARAKGSFEANTLGHIFSYLYVLESLYDGFFLVDSDLRYVVWNQGSERLLGHSSREMLGQVWSSRTLGYADKFAQPLSDQECLMNQVIAEGKPTTSTVQLRRADGKQVEVELQSVPLLDQQGQLHGVAEIFRDLSQNSRRPQEYRDLKLAASRDALTSVANRGELIAQLTLLTSEYSENSFAEPFSVIFLDVDFFKNINDTFGHAVGDQVLIDVAKLLQHETYSGELVARYGGEEFVILCPATELDQALRRAERLRATLSRNPSGGLTDFPVTASFGVAQAETGDTVESILRRADKALYQAKETGRNRSCALTKAELLAGDDEIDLDDEPASKSFTYTGTFNACVAADMIVYKLGGFVNDAHAKLVEVSPKRAVVRLGNCGLLPIWGRSDAKRPVELVVEFGNDPPNLPRSRRVASQQVPVSVRIRPLGWVRSTKVFQARARRVMNIMRSYFAAE
jgi:diguanylate cyclase (GGDEF)-like protein/PAS domain S-box-containing protein/putative nucleotidyltransferase with HDIG domain